VHPLDHPGSLLLDTARPGGAEQRSLWFRQPRAVFSAGKPADVPAVLQAADAARRAGAWVAGLLTYEAGVALTGLPVSRSASGPLVWLAAYDAPEGPPPLPEAAFIPEMLQPGWCAAQYTERHERVHALIREGDVYQVNLTFPMEGPFSAPGSRLYAGLRARQPVPFGALLSLEGRQVVSLSPELFFRIDPPDAAGGRRLTTRPMKGTAPRGRAPAEDAALRGALVADPKNRAENLMIVDLLRNDLSVVCEPGSVRVPVLFETEQHPTLTQMTSTVTGTLRPDVGLAGVFAALFPSGSITGAPKRRAMQRIGELEDAPRGAYCGALGYAAPDGTAVFSVAIRTVTLAGGQAVLGVGSGVTYDSVAADEYRECLLKARFLAP
jgi:para-aminobenzoate synthetase / 4-amino-4-deoxychorismate lyase